MIFPLPVAIRSPRSRAGASLLLLSILTACETPVQPAERELSPVDHVEAPTPLPSPPSRSGQVTLVNFDAAGHPLARFDTEGNSIDAHDGEIERFGDLYYLYGVSYGCGFRLVTPGTPFCGIRVYSSPDLVEWTDRGFLFDGSTPAWQQRCNGSQYGCFRPHVAYNEATSKYVLWINTYEVAGGFRVFESEAPTGPFVEREPPTVAVMAGARNGDHNLFVDADGTGYLAFTDWKAGGDLIVEQLTGDYLSGTGRSVRLGLRSVEAPSLFEREGRYYLTFGDPNCGYCRTGGSYLTAPHPLGPWSGRTRLIERCGGQPTHVAPFPSPGGGEVFLYQGDLWENFEPNQSTAAQFWAPLAFTSTGEIEPLDCAPHTYAPVLSSREPARDTTMASRARLVCDIGAGDSGRDLQAELRFTPSRAGTLRTLTLHLFKRFARPVPLLVRLSSPTGGTHRISIPAERIHWNARRLVLDTDLPLAAGEVHTVRLSAPIGEGCYGAAYLPTEGAPAGFSLFTSRDGGRSWSPVEDRTLMVELGIATE